jgi:hypothetical protein
MRPWLKKIISKLPFFHLKKTTQIDKLNDEDEENNVPWWGTFVIAEEQSRFFKIGSIIICLDRYNREWHINSYRNSELSTNENHLPSIPSSKIPYKSFATQGFNEIHLKPTLPDRALLAQLEHPFYIPVNETLLIYISSPVWIRIETGGTSILLDEIPTEILADTWFGKNTLEGELCYASEMHCSPRLEDLPRDTTCVITPILITNRSHETLLLKELRVPLPVLSIYSDAQNHLWTEQLNIVQEDYSSSEIAVIKGPPKTLKNCQSIQRARFGSKPGLKNLFSAMWK